MAPPLKFSRAASNARAPAGGLQRAELAAAQLPPLLVAARNVAATLMQGVHGRRRAGPGESFWQFRPYQPGDPAHRIDWRQTAKTDNVFIREREWVTAQSVWLWADRSPSMRYASRRGLPQKEERACLLILAVASVLVRSGEIVGLAGDARLPALGRGALLRMAERLERPGEDSSPGLPPRQPLPRHARLIIASDFLGPMDDIAASITDYAARGVTGHLVQVLDPAEETLPFAGRVRFEGLEAEGEALIDRAEAVRADYRRRLIARREEIAALAGRHGWSFTVHHTDRPPTEGLLALYGALAQPGTVS